MSSLSVLTLNHELLDPVTGTIKGPNTFAACLNAYGQYTTEHFVLRLSPRVHALISSIPPGIHDSVAISPDAIQAYSTYLHETVHWWQHVGTTAGLVFSLGYPAQTHGNLNHLQAYLEGVGPKKPILKWAEAAARQGMTLRDERLQAANSAVNNAIDIEFYKLFAFNPSCASDIFSNRYFECVGHSYWMAYGQLMSMLSTTFDAEFVHFPDARVWDEEFRRLKSARHLGFYHGSPIKRGPVGLQAIFEGQARFCQLQYLAFGSGTAPTFEELRAEGYLSGIYVEAFEQFLRLTKSNWPKSIDDPLIGLFLLICDLSLNPSAGFPLQIETYPDFIVNVDPGMRFARLSDAVAQTNGELRHMIRDYSKEEYISASESLVASCNYDHPMRLLEQVKGWTKAVPSVDALMKEHASFEFKSDNLPVRVIFSHFLSFSLDKLANPQFFCWPGAWMAGPRASETSMALFLSHLSLFSDKEDDDGVFPRKFPGKSHQATMQTFNTFFANNLLYDLTRQWILQDGPFTYDLSWLSVAQGPEQMAEAAKYLFEQQYGTNPDSFSSL